MTPKKRRRSARLTQPQQSEAQTPEAVVIAWRRRIHAGLSTLRTDMVSPPEKVIAAATQHAELRPALAWARLLAPTLLVPILALDPELQPPKKLPPEELEAIDRLLSPAPRKRGQP